MKSRALWVVLLIILITVSGCGREKSVQIEVYPAGTVRTTNDFTNLYKTWTTSLEDLAKQTKAVYKDWESGKIKTEEFILKAQEIHKSMQRLNTETDLNADFQLNDADKQMVNYDAVTNAYSKASKELNDFLYNLPRTKDDQIKLKYQEMMVEKYDKDVSDLKKLLKM